LESRNWGEIKIEIGNWKLGRTVQKYEDQISNFRFQCSVNAHLNFLDYLLEPFLETIKKYYRIERKEICFLKFIFEAYDGIAMLTTVDSDSGVVMFHIAPGCEDDVEMILQDLQHHIMIEEVL